MSRRHHDGCSVVTVGFRHLYLRIARFLFDWVDFGVLGFERGQVRGQASQAHSYSKSTDELLLSIIELFPSSCSALLHPAQRLI